MLFIIFGELGNDLHKAVHIAEITVHGSKSDICHMVDVLQLVQHQLSDLVGSHLALQGVLKLGSDLLYHVFDGFKGDGTFDGSTAQSVHQLFSIKRLDGVILFQHHQRHFFDYLIGREAEAALYTFTAAAHLVFGRAGVNDLAFLTAAFGTFHSKYSLSTVYHVA